MITSCSYLAKDIYGWAPKYWNKDFGPERIKELRRTLDVVYDGLEVGSRFFSLYICLFLFDSSSLLDSFISNSSLLFFFLHSFFALDLSLSFTFTINVLVLVSFLFSLLYMLAGTAVCSWVQSRRHKPCPQS